MAVGRIAAIGDQAAIEGFGLVGVLLCAARTPEEALVRWRSLPDDVTLVIVTPAVADGLPASTPGALPLVAVMPG